MTFNNGDYNNFTKHPWINAYVHYLIAWCI